MTRMDRLLKEFGDDPSSIPFNGASIDDNAGLIEIHYSAVPNTEQRTAAERIISEFDITKRVIQELTSVRSAVSSLSSGDQDTLFRAMAAAALQIDPYLGRRAGVAIDGDST